MLVWLANRDWEGLPAIGGSRFLWPVVIGVGVIVLIVMLINWTRIWVRASRKPFRYTYSIAEFKAIEDGSEGLPTSGHAAAGTEETDAGVGPTDEGEELTDEGEELTDEGEELTDEGEELTDEGEALTDEGVGPTDEGEALTDEGVGPTDEGVGPTDEGEEPTDGAKTRESEFDGELTEEESGNGTVGTTPLSWLVQDLTERLSRRIGRLSLLDEGLADKTTGQSHIHIAGTYGVRENAQGVWNVEVLPTVRIGGTESPATVAHLVKFTVGAGKSLAPEAYEKLLERLYFSVASHLYGQIRDRRRSQDRHAAETLLPRERVLLRSRRLCALEHARCVRAGTRSVRRGHPPLRPVVVAFLRLASSPLVSAPLRLVAGRNPARAVEGGAGLAVARTRPADGRPG